MGRTGDGYAQETGVLLRIDVDVSSKILVAGPALAQSFNFPVGGFSASNVCANSATPPPACQVLNQRILFQPQVASGGVLRFSWGGNQNQHGAAWFTVLQLSSGFTTAFQFQYLENELLPGTVLFPADGLALVIQNDPRGNRRVGQQMAKTWPMAITMCPWCGVGSAILKQPGHRTRFAHELGLRRSERESHRSPELRPNTSNSLSPNSGTTITSARALSREACPSEFTRRPFPAIYALTHTITVNYFPTGKLTSNCNNLSVYFAGHVDSADHTRYHPTAQSDQWKQRLSGIHGGDRIVG